METKNPPALSQPILSAGVASDVLAKLARYAESSMEGGGVYPHPLGDYVKLEDVQAALASAPAQPVAAIPEAGQSVPEGERMEIITQVHKHLVEIVCAFGEVSCARYLKQHHAPESIMDHLNGLASMSADAQSKGAMICPQCGVNRLKLPCPGMADECAMKADAHLAPAVQAGTAQGGEP